MKLKVNGGSTAELSEAIFGCEYNEGLVHQIVTAHMNAGRQGSKAQKTRAEVRGGGAKPWKQKGSGRARAGTTRGPLWRGGGVTFAAVTRDFSQKVNKKAYRKGIKIILSELVRQDRFVLTNAIDLPAPKTKELVSYLKGLDLSNVLIVFAGDNDNLYMSARNLPNVAVCDYTQVDPVSLLSFEKVLFTVDALKKIEENLAK
ncbi:MAG: 50S ribosomal protein L4 [Gammaproteobacteria bacterium CG_4_10_14_0_8_um_filter_38_16]|nr:MAG: 50S ribosomal protein L4 [Gammaproteobacteria bacterium CG_4_10_14_0_8_um_filter_38_16]PJA02895.1 MAG: 50S ribosomal protein L4 [Gammaproteobacteria bacterium CG_4_10_14_0_2_um_filter_38_22]PJB11438.1 MAG: 50S ribosomal protein L4 [Gammaproteobacteria bacterium CG_4_9_14_3_um_filter_38_9]